MIRPASTAPFGLMPKIETHVILAKHRGRCMPPGCRGAIRKDEPIPRVDGRWIHEECAPAGAIDCTPPRREAA
jgi:hypothetical protein